MPDFHQKIHAAVSRKQKLNLSFADGRVKPALPCIASIRSAAFQASPHKPINFE
jgi:hypothetical protein